MKKTTHTLPSSGEVVVGDTSEDALWIELRDAVSRDRETRPPGKGWKTLEEIGEILGIKESHTRRVVKSMLSVGKVELFRGRMMAGGQLSNRTWYRLKRGGGK